MIELKKSETACISGGIGLAETVCWYIFASWLMHKPKPVEMTNTYQHAPITRDAPYNTGDASQN